MKKMRFLMIFMGFVLMISAVSQQGNAGIIDDILTYLYGTPDTSPIITENSQTLIGDAPQKTYGNGYSITTNADGSKSYTEGVQTYLRYDGEYQPISEMNIDNGNWTYWAQDNGTFYTITNDNVSFKIPKKNWIDYNFMPDTIKETITIQNISALISRSIVHNATVRYIPLDFSPSIAQKQEGNMLELGRFKTGDFWIKDANESYYDVTNHYQLKVINGEIRLYFDNLTWFQNASYPIIIDPTWIIGNSSGSTWTGVTYTNTRKHNDQSVWIDYSLYDFISFWDFEDGRWGVRTANDLNLTNENNGALTSMNLGVDNGTSGWTTLGKTGYGLNFDGTNDYVNIGNGISLNITKNITLAGWFKTGDTTHIGTIVSKWGGSGNRAYRLSTNLATANKVAFRLSADGTTLSSTLNSSTDVTDDVFHFGVGIYNGTQISIYVDGVLERSKDYTGDIYHTAGSVVGVIGAVTAGTANFFNGTLDDVSIFNRALSTSEVLTMYANPFLVTGNITSDSKDAESIGSVGDVWKNISFEANIPTNTNVSIYINSSSDGTTWSGYSLLQSAATSGTTYTLAVGDQKRYTSWMLHIEGNRSSTPNIFNVTMTSATGDTTPPLITIQSPLNQTYSTNSIWFNITLDETGSWAGYSLDGAANVSLTNSSGNWNNLSTVAEGYHNVTFYANDTTGNMNSTTQYFTVNGLNNCTNLSTAGAYYTLTQNVSSSGTCFNILADNITFDGQGYTINFSGTSSGYGVFNNGFKNATTKNVNIVQTNHSVNNAAGIRYWQDADNGTISNTATWIYGNDSYGIWIDLSNYTNITNNVANSTNDYGINIDDADSNTLTNNTGNSSSFSGIFITASKYNTLVNNTGNSDSNYGIYLILSANNTLTNNTGYSKTDFGIFLYTSSDYNILTNNTGRSDTGYAFGIWNPKENRFIQNSPISPFGKNYYLSGTTIAKNNTFIGLGETQTESVYFAGTTSYLIQMNGSVKVQTGINTASQYIQRRVFSLNNTNITWDENTSASVTLSYSVNGLLPSTNYNISNSTTSQTITSNSSGALEFNVYFTSGVNTAMSIIQISDTTPPTITIVSPTNTTYSQNWIWANVTLNEAGSWCGVSLNSTANQTLSNTSQTAWYLNLSVPTVGANNVKFWCNDTAGNMGNSSTVYFTTSSGGDQCACPSINTNKAYALSDYCVLTSSCDYGTGNVTFTGDGNITFGDDPTDVFTANSFDLKYILASSARYAKINGHLIREG